MARMRRNLKLNHLSLSSPFSSFLALGCWISTFFSGFGVLIRLHRLHNRLFLSLSHSLGRSAWFGRTFRRNEIYRIHTVTMNRMFVVPLQSTCVCCYSFRVRIVIQFCCCQTKILNKVEPFSQHIEIRRKRNVLCVGTVIWYEHG